VTPATGAGLTSDQMRAEADQQRAAAKDQQRAAFETGRLADQLEHEARLNDAADAAEAALDAAREHVPGLQREADDAFAAQRDAEDKVRAAEKFARRCAQRAARAAAQHMTPDVQTDTRRRAELAAEVVIGEQRALARAQQARQQAEAVRDAAEARAGQLETAYVQASAVAANPGVAARSSAPTSIEDLDEGERDLLRLTVLTLAAAGTSAAAPAGPSPKERMRDPTKFRTMRNTGGQIFIVPPALPT
jgi:hypothetical protein